MNKPASVFFTGMDVFDAEQLSALFQDANRRTGNHWQLASGIDSAGVLVIDVDTLYGHMTWLRSQNSEHAVVALTSGTSAEADHILHRPVTMDAMRRLLHDLRARDDIAAARPTEDPSEAAAPSPVEVAADTPVEPPAAAVAATVIEEVAVTPPLERQVASAPQVAASAASAASTPTNSANSANSVNSNTPVEFKLIDALLSGDMAAGPQVLELPGLQPLALDMTEKVFLCGNGIKSYLPHTKVLLESTAWKPISSSEFETLGKNLGGTQPLGRLVWLAALGRSDGLIHGADPDARYRLSKWPQIEREFPRHFRIATTMMKGYLTPEQIAEHSGASVLEVNEFIVASMVSGHAEAEPTAVPTEVAPTAPRSLLERLRGSR